MTREVISSLELARICGVSQGTVDRALHDRPGIAADTKERILAAAEKHGYLPHPGAREMLAGERTVVGAVLPASHTMYFWDLALALKEAFSQSGCPFHIAPVENEEEFQQAATEFACRRVRGLILIPPAAGIKLPKAILSGIRTAVLFNPLENAETVFVSPDEIRAGFQAAEYLFSKGHRRIIHLTIERDFPSVEQRAKGYLQFMRDTNLEPTVIPLADPGEIEGIIDTHKPDAVFAFNDWQALTLIRKLLELGKRVPEDVAVMGVDASPGFLELAPGITSMAYPYTAVARSVAEYTTGSASSPENTGIEYFLQEGNTA